MFVAYFLIAGSDEIQVSQIWRKISVIAVIVNCILSFTN
ncbi:hypothetical protein RV01_GL001466 [Enterococcus dispar]|nr:hypothetical protein RV01_GL001466 [Enterococcus dispar]